jgi:hypothetical protein
VDSEELIMVPVSQDISVMLTAELAVEDDRRPRHSLMLDGVFCPGLFSVTAVHGRPTENGRRLHLAYFRMVK